MASTDLDIARRILELAEATANTDIPNLVKATRAWPEECASAYLIAHQRLYDQVPDKLREAKAYIPAESLPDRLRNELAEADRRLPNVQSLRWPIIRRIPTSVSLDPPPLFIERVLGGVNPFPYQMAEKDQMALFGSLVRKDAPAAFWADHRLFTTLRNAERPHVIMGEEGSGKTAMALALGRYNVGGGARLWLYLPGQPDTSDIRLAYAQLLLSVVQTRPTLLSKLSAAERVLLARVLVNELGKDLVRAEIKAAQISEDWLIQAQDDADRRYWQQIGNVQFNLLEEVVIDVPEVQMDESHWPRAIRRCARSLGFEQERIFVVIDSATHDPGWAKRMLLPHLFDWWQSGMVGVIFLPKQVGDLIKIADGVTECSVLSWAEDNALERMLRYRYSSVRGRRRQLDEVFEAGVLAKLMEHSKQNPARFITLWNACLREADEQESRISLNTLQRAREHEARS